MLANGHIITGIESSPTVADLLRRTIEHGFTLVEMAIVLAVIGLFVGGILVARDLIRASELRSTISDVEKFKSAVNAFKLRFNCIPGDCANATDFFGTDPNGCHPTVVNTTPKTETCNGTGTDTINDYNNPAVWRDQMFRFWQQLAAANLIPGMYSGYSVLFPGECGVPSQKVVT
jgi:prepilin-type N-terminal cleavage/methylation domain-containing protein